MLFHAGAAIRLNELGILPAIKRFSSVSGGSIFAGILATAWDELQATRTDGMFDAAMFSDLVVQRCIKTAQRGIDVMSLVRGLISSKSITQHVAEESERPVWTSSVNGKTAPLFDAQFTLAKLPADVDFVFNSTTLNTGTRWTASRQAFGDDEMTRIWEGSQTGISKKPAESYIVHAAVSTVGLSLAVAASCAFPPVLSPLYTATHNGQPPAMLVDGGVYDNFGFESASNFKNILISDGGGVFDAARHVSILTFGTMAVRAQLKRVFDAVDARARAHLRNQFFELYAIERDGAVPEHIKNRYGRLIAYWWMDPDPPRETQRVLRRALVGQALQKSGPNGPQLLSPQKGWGRQMPVLQPNADVARALARLPTGLATIQEAAAKQIVNLGYARCDQYIRMMWGHLPDDTLSIKNTPPNYPFKTPINIEAPLSARNATFISNAMGLSLVQLVAIALACLGLFCAIIAFANGFAMGNVCLSVVVIAFVLIIVFAALRLTRRTVLPVGTQGVHF